MGRVSLLIFVVLTACSSLTPQAQAAVLKATTCSRTDVANTIAAASDGDTVQVPAGTCSWNSAVSVTKAITIIGAGIDQTVIKDDVPRDASGNASLFAINTPEGKNWRLSGFTLQRGSVAGNAFNAAIAAFGGSKAFRIDHIKFNDLLNNGIRIVGDMWGVIDHCEGFTSGVYAMVDIWHTTFGGSGQYGDKSWAMPTNLGSEQAVFLEDNSWASAVTVGAIVDSKAGGRYVARYNTLKNVFFQNHGTETTGRYRSGRSMEIYNNTLSGGTFVGVVFRGGTGVVYNNTVSASYAALTGAQNDRDPDQYLPEWGRCDGTGRFDKNDGIVYASGTHTGVNGVLNLLTDSTKSFQLNQWVAPQGSAYSVRNTTKGWGSYITANSGNTITSSPATHESLPHTWSTGDNYQILRASVCLDQPGRGQGNLISGDSPSPTEWPNQALEPIYVWGNTMASGAPEAVLLAPSAHLRIGRDVIVGTPMPGYTPFPYPHPLVSGSTTTVTPVPPTTSPGSSTTTSISAPTNLQVR